MSKAAELAALIANVNNGSSLASKNFIQNGNMNVAQRGTSTTGLGADGATYNTADRFCHSLGNTAGRFTSAIIADGPSGFANCLKLSCTTADTSVAATEYFHLQHRMEGQNLQSIAKGTADAKPLTASFYVKGNASATYVAELYDADNTRQISKTFSVTTSWSRVELTFPADTSGALDDDNALSLQLAIHLHDGSNFTSGTTNSSAWASATTANRGNSSATSFFDSTSRTFFLTGVQLEIGEKATEFEHEPYGTTLAKCQRYFEKSFNQGQTPAQNKQTTNGSLVTSGVSTSANTLLGHINFAVVKRALPTMTTYNPYAADSGWSQSGAGDYTQSIYVLGTSSMAVRVNEAPSTASANMLIDWTADSEL